MGNTSDTKQNPDRIYSFPFDPWPFIGSAQPIMMVRRKSGGLAPGPVGDLGGTGSLVTLAPALQEFRAQIGQQTLRAIIMSWCPEYDGEACFDTGFFVAGTQAALERALPTPMRNVYRDVRAKLPAPVMDAVNKVSRTCDAIANTAAVRLNHVLDEVSRDAAEAFGKGFRVELAVVETEEGARLQTRIVAPKPDGAKPPTVAEMKALVKALS